VTLPQLRAAWTMVLGVAGAALGLASLVWNARTAIRVRRLQGAVAGAAPDALDRLLRSLQEAEGRARTLERRTDALEEAMRSRLLRPGLVRFRAYDAAGPLLSFALAVVDGRGDGVVLTSLYGRTASHVFVKHVAGGQGRVELGPEEEAALRLAREGGGYLEWDDTAPPRGRR
jgi:hypothetical protein